MGRHPTFVKGLRSKTEHIRRPRFERPSIFHSDLRVDGSERDGPGLQAVGDHETAGERVKEALARRLLLRIELRPCGLDPIYNLEGFAVITWPSQYSRNRPLRLLPSKQVAESRRPSC